MDRRRFLPCRRRTTTKPTHFEVAIWPPFRLSRSIIRSFVRSTSTGRGKSFLRTDSRFGTVPRALHGKKGVKIPGKVGEIRGATSDVNLYSWVTCSLSDRQGACSTVSMKKTCSQSNHLDAHPLGGNIHPMGVGGIQSDYPTSHTLRIELGHTFRSGWRKTHSRPRLADSDIKI